MHAHAPALLRELRTALLARAAALGIGGASEEAIIDTLLDRDVRIEPASEAERRSYYAQRESLFRAGTLVEVDHILFAPKKDSQRNTLRRFAQDQLLALLDNVADFAESARRWSNCSSSALGGNLGQLTRSDVVPEFWQPIEDFAHPGLLPQLVETRYGFHIVRINRFETGPLLPFEAVRGRIEERIAQEKLVIALREYAHALTHDERGERAQAH